VDNVAATNAGHQRYVTVARNQATVAANVGPLAL
jgi:hypothetical protein